MLRDLRAGCEELRNTRATANACCCVRFTMISAGGRRTLALAAVLLTACAPASGSLALQLTTDYVPSMEFDVVRVRVMDAVGADVLSLAADRAVTASDAFLRPRRLEEALVPTGHYLARITLEHDGLVVQERTRPIEVSGTTIATVGIFRRCEGMCGTDGTRVTADGVCVCETVSPSCSDTHPELCATCDPALCPPPVAACAAALCVSGSCAVGEVEGACASGVCDPDQGCIASHAFPVVLEGTITPRDVTMDAAGNVYAGGIGPFDFTVGADAFMGPDTEAFLVSVGADATPRALAVRAETPVGGTLVAQIFGLVPGESGAIVLGSVRGILHTNGGDITASGQQAGIALSVDPLLRLGHVATFAGIDRNAQLFGVDARVSGSLYGGAGGGVMGPGGMLLPPAASPAPMLVAHDALTDSDSALRIQTGGFEDEVDHVHFTDDDHACVSGWAQRTIDIGGPAYDAGAPREIGFVAYVAVRPLAVERLWVLDGSSVRPPDVAVDGSGNCVVAATSAGRLLVTELTTMPTPVDLPAGSGSYAVLARLTPSGAIEQLTRVSNATRVFLTRTASGFLAAGSFTGELSLGRAGRSTARGRDAFVLALDGSFVPTRLTSFGGTGDEEAIRAFYDAGELVIVGIVGSSSELSPGRPLSRGAGLFVHRLVAP